MKTSEIITITSVAIAWNALWLQFAVLPLFWKREKLYKEYESGGELDAALGSIESNKIVPALAEMFDRLLETRKDKRKTIDIEELLQSVDFLPDFRRAGETYRELVDLEDSYSRYVKSTDQWRWGLAHAVVTLFLAAAFPDYASMGAWSWLRPPVLLPLAAVPWAFTLFLLIRGMWSVNTRMRDFLSRLERAKGRDDGN